VLRFLFLIALTVTACADPCEQVAQTICDCEDSDAERLSCLSEVDAAKAISSPSDEQLAACDAVIAAGSCTCDALTRGDRAACGVTEQP